MKQEAKTLQYIRKFHIENQQNLLHGEQYQELNLVLSNQSMLGTA